MLTVSITATCFPDIPRTRSARRKCVTWEPHFQSTDTTFFWIQVTDFKSIVAVVDRFCIVLFSALEQTHCALVVCDFKPVTVSFYSVFVLNDDAVWLLHGWCYVKLLPSRHTFRVHHAAMHQFSVTLFLATYVRMIWIILYVLLR